ncbi:hypothetical protein [Sessilibacter corallicola]|uniref:hypothetical protein n=1 Tax=Sessilibacter corallicola TaxID=2904075 RepID=UPI001E446179|nr:hypothetical protein [Sessilibacter corallicola]MCE2029708.1 hypothetical protein [Sessilibacter corallicola]
MEILILAVIIVVPIYGTSQWVIARHKIVKHIALNHPSLWNELHLGSAMGEVSGYSTQLSKWISSKGLSKISDPNLYQLACKYQRSKIIVILCVIISILFFGSLSGVND